MSRVFFHQRAFPIDDEENTRPDHRNYVDAVSKTSVSSRVAGLQTLPTEEGIQMVLSVTPSDGNNVKYLIKLPRR